MATSKVLRAPPPRVLEKYVASIRHLRSVEPRTEPDKSFVNFVDDGISAFGISDIFDHDIGFGFEINGITYKRFAVYPGFVLLQDPAATPAISDFNSSGFAYSNGTIKTNFTNNHVLLCPWYDAQEYVSSTAKNLSLATSYNSTVTSTVLNNIKEGRDSQAWPFDHVDHGIRYKNANSARYGKCLLVRFSCFVTNDTKPNRLKYEVAIFENGRIEFRYWPRITYKKGDTLSTNLGDATCGIFWSGPSLGSNKFRDFAPLLDYKKDKRTLSEFGASEYQAGYSESGVPYANLIKNVNWPTGGGIITFSPPINQAKFLPKSVVKSISNSRAIEPQPGVFDDRKTITYKSTTEVHVPSSLPSRLLGDTGDVDVSLRQQLISPNGFKTTGNVKPSIVENLINQLDASERSSEPARDSIFNETKYNYNTTSFYMTGSSSEYSGLGFDAPLQSQVQFNFSLPVNKPVTMLANTASLYYYDNKKKQWGLIAAGSDPERSAEGTPFTNDYLRDNYQGYYRVTESAIGFDAVGRKVVSGSVPFFTGYPKQSKNETIGVKVNLPKGKFNSINRYNLTLNEMPGISHDAGMTDNSSLFPSSDQLLNLQSDFPFLIQKIVVDIPLFASGSWFKDFTTCKRPWSQDPVPSYAAYTGYNVGPVDFGGPALTFSLFCARKGEAKSYVDIIASGTITHNFDNITGSLIEKNNTVGSPVYYSVRPVGFKNFSNPTTVVSGTWNGSTHTYNGKVRLEMHASHATGITFAKNDVWQKHPELADTINASLSRGNLYNLLTSPTLKYADRQHSNKNYFEMTGSRVYVQQVCPYARGTSRFESSGNSTLLGSFVPFDIEQNIKNPLYTKPEDVNTSLVSTVGANNWDGTTILSTVDSKVSPYLILPGDRIGISMSKVRPILEKCRYLGVGGSGGPAFNYRSFGNYTLTGSHHGVVLNTGSIDITIYGSYVSQGTGYVP